MVTALTARQLAVLHHLRRYRVSLRPVLDRIFYAGEGDGCKRDLEALRAHGCIEVVENAVADPEQKNVRYSYYLLARRGAALLEIPGGRTSRVGPDALTRHLAHLWYCCCDRQRRHRLLDDDLTRLFAPPDEPARAEHSTVERIPGFHCLARGGEQFLVQQMYAPHTPAADILGEVRKRLALVEEHPRL